MRAVIQRVERASVSVDDQVLGSIGRGLMVLVAVQKGDGPRDRELIKRKILNLRVFPDSRGKMEHSVRDVGGEVMLISQFTLFGDCRRGNRPSYSRAAKPEFAEDMYEQLIEALRAEGMHVEEGRFQVMMKIELVNVGPVTLIVDSRKEFY